MRRYLILPIFCALLLTAHSASAQRLVGNWHVDAGEGRIYAATVNDSGHVFGQYCYPGRGKCYWLLGISTGCKSGDKYPVLVNTDSGAASLEMYCFGEVESAPGKYQYAFTEFDSIDTAVKKSQRIGIAIPLEGDQFRVVRFDLTGASTAVSAMRDVAEKVQKTRGTRDEKL